MKYKLRKFVIKDDQTGHYIPEKMPGVVSILPTAVEPVQLETAEPRLFDTTFAASSFIKQWRRGKRVDGKIRELPHRVKRKLTIHPVVVSFEIGYEPELVSDAED